VTRRFRAAAWAVGSASVLVLGAWALIGFDGLRDYPRLLRVVQDVYAIRSVSLSTVAGALGAPVWLAVAVAGVAGIVLIGAAARVAGRPDGDRRAFALLVAGCILASPIVWPNYPALLFVPIAITWPRLAPAWFFGYAIWLAAVFSPKPVAREVCCRPDHVEQQAWDASHADPAGWFAAGSGAVVVTVAVVAIVARRGAARASSEAWTNG
jgi:Glycosyltransferase family 87